MILEPLAQTGEILGNKRAASAPAAPDRFSLNLGSRGTRIDGFKNMDIDPHPGVDFVGDVSDLSRFEDSSIDSLYASNILEHFSHARTGDILKEWRRVLVKGGRLYLSVPDFERAVYVYSHCGMGDDRWVEKFICGDQEYKTAFHYAIFDKAKVGKLSKEAGYVDCIFVREFEVNGEYDCSDIKSTLDREPVCLNAILFK